MEALKSPGLDQVVAPQAGHQRQVADFQTPGSECFSTETFGCGRQTFDESLAVVAAGPKGLVVLHQGVEVEVEDGQVLDVMRDLVDDEVAVLAQDGYRVLISLFGDHLTDRKSTLVDLPQLIIHTYLRKSSVLLTRVQ